MHSGPRVSQRASPVHTPQRVAAHTAALARMAPQSLPWTSPSMVSTGLSSPAADPKHTTIESSSAASSSMQADTREVAEVAVFEAPALGVFRRPLRRHRLFRLPFSGALGACHLPPHAYIYGLVPS